MIAKQLPNRFLLCSAAALLAALPAIAQQSPTPGGSMPGQAQPSNPNANPNMTGPGAYPGTAPGTQMSGDTAFVSKALAGGEAEVQLGKLAQEKSQSQDVKLFGQKMVNDHSQMGDKWFKPIAKQLGMSEPSGPSKKDRKLIEKLQGLSGSEFDTEYIKAMVKDHQEDLKEFKTEAQSGQDPNVKQAAEQGTTIISHHLQMIEQIAKSHNVPIEGNTESSSIQ